MLEYIHMKCQSCVWELNDILNSIEQRIRLYVLLMKYCCKFFVLAEVIITYYPYNIRISVKAKLKKYVIEKSKENFNEI